MNTTHRLNKNGNIGVREQGQGSRWLNYHEALLLNFLVIPCAVSGVRTLSLEDSKSKEVIQTLPILR